MPDDVDVDVDVGCTVFSVQCQMWVGEANISIYRPLRKGKGSTTVANGDDGNDLAHDPPDNACNRRTV